MVKIPRRGKPPFLKAHHVEDGDLATNIEEAKQLLAVGFDYLTEKNDIMLFRRPKRFGV